MFFDTEFLICPAGGRGAPKQKRAPLFLEQNQPSLYTSRVCWMEFAAGCGNVEAVDTALEDFVIVEIDKRVAWETARILSLLKGQGLHIGDNDVWIAATALVYGLPLVSNNARHLGRVPGLELRGY